MKKQTRLPRTSRVNDKIMEYYLKFGQERDLEKFMRLYSPAASSSHCSKSRTTTATSNTTDSSCSCASACSDVEGGIMRRLFQQQEAHAAINTTTKSLPNISLQQQQQQEEEQLKAVEPQSSSEMINIPIKQMTTDEEQALKNTGGRAENEHKTPKKSHKFEEKLEIRTPESVAKIHKRLEWDSLADVGYPKSKSTSNISTIERTLLRELFQEQIPADMLQTNASESDLKKLQSEQQRGILLKKSACQNTPPLASSTFHETLARKSAAAKCLCMAAQLKSVETSASSSYDTHDKPSVPEKSSNLLRVERLETVPSTSEQRKKRQSTCTSSSLVKQQDKCAQTSNENMRTQQVQVDLSSLSSAMGSSVTPSSFEEYSSRASAATSSAQDDAVEGDLIMSCRRSHPFIVGLSNMLAERKAMATQTKQFTDRSAQCSREVESLQKIHDTFRQALQDANGEDKENTKSSSVRSHRSICTSPELELGIQLLCSLIEAKSLKQKRKHELVRAIVKRILLLSGDQSRLTSSKSSTASDSREHRRQSSTEIDNISRLVLESIESSSKLTKTGDCEEDSKRNTAKQAKHHAIKAAAVPENEKPSSLKTKAQKVHKGRSTKDSNTQTSARAPLGNLCTPNIAAAVAAAAAAAVTPPSATSSSVKFVSTTSTNSSATHTSQTSEPTTQKPAVLVNNGRSDVELHTTANDSGANTMREWLNPLTESEIAYEERKRELAKLEKKRKQRKMAEQKEPERLNQIHWLDNEIKRLESLRALLSKQDSQRSPSSLYTTIPGSAEEQHSYTEKLYDTVHTSTAKSSLLSESAEREAREIALIIEETIDETPSSPKQLIDCSTQVATADLDRQCGKQQQNPTKNGNKAKASDIADPHAEVTPPPLPPRQQQRSKIDTPSDSRGSESVGSFVQHRKTVFMEQYKNKKQSHHEALLRQQQTEALNLKQRKTELQQQSRKSYGSHHYTMPHTRAACQTCSAQHVHHHSHGMQPSYHCAYCTIHMPYTFPLPTLVHPTHALHVPTTATTNTKSRGTQAKSAQPAHKQPQYSSVGCGTKSAKLSTTPTSEELAQHTTSSSFRTTTTDVSIPMGSKNTTSTSTTTTTHQYDEVVAAAAAAAGVSCKTSAIGVQTDPNAYSSSLLPYTYKPTSQTACVQVKPKGIAYIIQFDKSNDKLVNSHSSQPSFMQQEPSSSVAEEAIQLPLTLQEHLKLGKPEFVAQSKARKALLNELHTLRQARERELRQIIENTSINSMERNLKERLPPPATSKVRLFPTCQMKAMTRRSVANLPEVLAKQQRDKEERRRRGNRILRDIFNRRLQRRVHKGQLSLNHSRTVI